MLSLVLDFGQTRLMLAGLTVRNELVNCQLQFWEGGRIDNQIASFVPPYQLTKPVSKTTTPLVPWAGFCVGRLLLGAQVFEVVASEYCGRMLLS